MTYTRKLDPIEQRVVGALMEKQQTTPDYYPMTVNALIAACNQKSNREPVTALSETEIVGALESLRHDTLVWRSEGARVERWEHRLTSRWHLDTPARAIMTLLLLRGPQTPGELRSRSERMHHFEDVSEVDAVLRRLAQGDDALVRVQPREPGKRERRWCHVMGTDTVDSPKSGGIALGELGPESGAPSTAVSERRLDSADASRSPRQEGDLEARVAALERRVASLERRTAPVEPISEAPARDVDSD